MKVRIVFFIFSWIFCFSTHAFASDPLPSWQGPVKKNIIQFVDAVTNKSNPDYKAPEDRIATIDNDGTLWVEQPIYTQIIFALDRLKNLAPQHPEWYSTEPFKSALEHHFENLTTQDYGKIIAVTSSGVPIEDYQKIVKTWLATAENPHFHHLYTDLIYQPMLEVMNYLRANHFRVYIVSGGGQDFIRAYSLKTYNVPVEQVIGTMTKTKYVYRNGKAALIKIPELLLLDDNVGKPQGINLFIGKRPLIAFGNSDGDRQMLEWTQSGDGKRMMLLVHHDDAKREFAYDTQSKVGTFSKSLMQEAEKNHWNVISMKDDWKVIFPFEKN